MAAPKKPATGKVPQRRTRKSKELESGKALVTATEQAKELAATRKSRTRSAAERESCRPKGDITLDSIIELKLSNPNLTLQEAAKILGCSHSNIAQRLKSAGTRWTDITTGLKQFKDSRADILALTQRRILTHLSDAKLKNSSAQQLVTMFGILFDKERIERGKTVDTLGMMVVLIQQKFSEALTPGNKTVKVLDIEATEPRQIEA